jgi:hypothetical protein
MQGCAFSVTNNNHYEMEWPSTHAVRWIMACNHVCSRGEMELPLHSILLTRKGVPRAGLVHAHGRY